MCYDSCSIPTPNSPPAPSPGFKMRDRTYNTYGNQALHSFAEKHKKQSHKSRYALAARKLLANVGVPTWQPPPKSLLSTIDINLTNIREWAILDSGASSHFLQAEAPLIHKKKTASPVVVVTVANGNKVSSTHEGFIDVPGLTERARNAHMLPGIKHSLFSIVRLCNAGCEVVFGKRGVNVIVRYNGRVIMTGSKSTTNGLWYVPITQNCEVNPKQHPEPRQKDTIVPDKDLNLMQNQEIYGSIPDRLSISNQQLPQISRQLVQRLSIKRKRKGMNRSKGRNRCVSTQAKYHPQLSSKSGNQPLTPESYNTTLVY